MASSNACVSVDNFWHKNLTFIPKFCNSFIESFSNANLPIKASLTRGYKFFFEEFIHEIEVKNPTGDIGASVKAKCFRSMKKHEEAHKLNVVFGKNLKEAKVEQFSCSCAAGKGLCHHVIGLLYTLEHFQKLDKKSVPPIISSTSKPQQWHIPKRKDGIKPRPATDIVVQKTKKKPLKVPKKKRIVDGIRSTIYKPFQQPLKSLNILQKLAPVLQQLNPKPSVLKLLPTNDDEITYVQSEYGEVPTGSVISYHLPLRQSSLKLDPTLQPPNFTLPDLSSFCTSVLPEKQLLFYSSLDVSIEEMIEYETSTRDQSSNKDWHRLRKHRITASNFKRVCSRRKDFESLADKLIKGKTFQSAAMKYGIQHEDEAASYYSREFCLSITTVGFVINPSIPHLGCSPDRRVHDPSESQTWGLLEIKCSMADGLRNLKYLKYNESTGKFSLQKSHIYYYQVMGCMGLTGSSWCDFFVYCKEEFHCERIHFDEVLFFQMLDKLNVFYFAYFLPKCVS